MLDTENCLQDHISNAKTTKILLQSGFDTTKGRTCKVLSFYDFWFEFYDKFCDSTQSSAFYAYFITKIWNRNPNLTLNNS